MTPEGGWNSPSSDEAQSTISAWWAAPGGLEEITFDLRYDLGLTNLMKNSGSDSIKNRALVASVVTCSTKLAFRPSPARAGGAFLFMEFPAVKPRPPCFRFPLPL